VLAPWTKLPIPFGRQREPVPNWLLTDDGQFIVTELQTQLNLLQQLSNAHQCYRLKTSWKLPLMSHEMSFTIPLDRLGRLHQIFHDRQGLPDRRSFLK